LLDMELVARILRRAGVQCLLHAPDDRTTVLLAEPRPGDSGFAVRATLVRERGREHLSVGPNDTRRAALPVPKPDERRVAAFVLAQALRVEPGEPVTADEVRALGLGC
jgi:hypothetical protein